MKIIVENKIPFIAGVLEPAGTVDYLPPEAITPGAVADADALIVRTRTRCDAALLEGSRVKWIATATIGTDHIDLDYCRRRGIKVVNAPGCNAPAVAQWVFAAIAATIDPAAVKGMTLGIVGVGHVGRIVARWARALGIEVMLCDPPRVAAGDAEAADFVDHATLAACSDIITFHVPVTAAGPWPTRHLLDRRFMCNCARRPLILNAARGPVASTADLLDALASGLIGGVAIDCWEGEPAISLDLLNRAAVATPHVAGYSLEGKQRATAMVVDAFARDHAGIATGPLPFDRPALMPPPPVSLEAVAEAYDIMADDRALRANPRAFESLRNNYNYRHEN